MKIPATLCVHVQGADGQLTAVRRVNLPCTPFDGMAVDGLRVQRSSWETGTDMWRLTLEGYSQIHGDAMENFAELVGQVNVKDWQMEFKKA